MKTKILIVFIVLAVAVFVFFYLGKGRPSLNLKDIPETPINKICLKISQPDNIYYCLAAANQDVSFCQNLAMPAEKKLCSAMAARDISYCREIQEPEPKKVCYYELSFLTGNFDYCQEMENPNECYFAFLYRLHWESRADEIKSEYCQKIDENSPGGLVIKNCCHAFRKQDLSLCQGNKYCLSFFKQPLSFCQTEIKLPGGKVADKDECFLHRALSEKDSSICEKIESSEGRDGCYADMSTHISPDLSFCDKITNKMTRDMCYAEYAIYLSEH